MICIRINGAKQTQMFIELRWESKAGMFLQELHQKVYGWTIGWDAQLAITEEPHCYDFD